MEFEIACTCGQGMLVESDFVGEQVECPGCGGLLTVPEPPESEDQVPVVAPEAPSVIPTARSVEDSPPPPPPPPPSPEVQEARPIELGYAGPLHGPPRTNGKAVAALLLSILAYTICPVVGNIAALVLASMAKSEIRANPQVFTGEGLATAAQWIAAAPLIFILLVFGLLMSV